MGNNELKAIDEGRRPPKPGHRQRRAHLRNRRRGPVGPRAWFSRSPEFWQSPSSRASDRWPRPPTTVIIRRDGVSHWLAMAPGAALGLMTMASPSDDGPTLCPVALLTGVACPGCGMSRAMAWLLRGDLERS